MVEREVGELRELGDGGGDGARQLVAVQVEVGEAGEPEDGLGDGARELTATEVQVSELLADAAELRWNTARNPDIRKSPHNTIRLVTQRNLESPGLQMDEPAVGRVTLNGHATLDIEYSVLQHLMSLWQLLQ